ncbi:MAG: hypothetical protein DMF85_19075 [Acidobacteria bacterium]|nr:MAG: hypothetical protein DMF85_19075 [Acidobacteriota bacterium]PYR80692.1 MAG: hypothetical protein DMF86_00045 [Acidobacteriota bacterium]
MRRYVVSLVFAGCVAAAAPLAAQPAMHDETSAAQPAPPAMAVQQVRVPLPGFREEAAMVLVGTALIGIAAAVRRAA